MLGLETLEYVKIGFNKCWAGLKYCWKKCTGHQGEFLPDIHVALISEIADTSTSFDQVDKSLRERMIDGIANFFANTSRSIRYVASFLGSCQGLLYATSMAFPHATFLRPAQAVLFVMFYVFIPFSLIEIITGIKRHGPYTNRSVEASETNFFMLYFINITLAHQLDPKIRLACSFTIPFLFAWIENGYIKNPSLHGNPAWRGLPSEDFPSHLLARVKKYILRPCIRTLQLLIPGLVAYAATEDTLNFLIDPQRKRLGPDPLSSSIGGAAGSLAIMSSLSMVWLSWNRSLSDMRQRRHFQLNESMMMFTASMIGTVQTREYALVCLDIFANEKNPSLTLLQSSLISLTAFILGGIPPAIGVAKWTRQARVTTADLQAALRHETTSSTLATATSLDQLGHDFQERSFQLMYERKKHHAYNLRSFLSFMSLYLTADVIPKKEIPRRSSVHPEQKALTFSP